MPPNTLTRLQVCAARLFFKLPESAGFAVAGGARLIAQGMIHRPTMDIDLFLVDTATSEVAVAAASFEAALDSQSWSHHRVIDQHDFIRLEIHSNQQSVIVDLGIDSPPEQPVDTTDLGPTLSPRDLAARKTLALFSRAEARGFDDVYDLARSYGRDQLLAWAAADDPGFDQHTSSPPCSPASTGSPTRTCPYRTAARTCDPTSTIGPRRDRRLTIPTNSK